MYTGFHSLFLIIVSLYLPAVPSFMTTGVLLTRYCKCSLLNFTIA